MSELDPGCRVRRDLQRERPAVTAALSRAGVTDLRRIISIQDGEKPELFYATLDLFADLSPEQTGVHMSRFSEVVEDLAEGLTRTPFPDIESLARRMAEQVMETQEALRAEVRIKAQSPMVRTTPVSQRPTEELYTLVGIAAATRRRTRLLVGVEVNGLTVCPCAQGMVREQSIDLLREDGYDEEESARIVDRLPIASHNQRGRGTLLIGSERRLRAEELVGIVEESMSSEIYELLKRPDELYVVEKAHRNPRFVEDAVREMLRLVVERFPDLPGDAFVLARQENFEGNLAHSLKTPLAAIRTVLPEAGAAAAPQVATVQGELGRMDRIIAWQLRRAAAVSAAGVGLAPVPIAPVVRDLAAILDKVYREREVGCEIDLAEDLRFRGDEGDLQEMLGNVLDNAWKYGRRRVRVSGSRGRVDTVRLTVEDDGPGLAPARAEEMMARGARLDESHPGQGIGLAVVRELVTAYGGRITVEASSLGGAAVVLELPGG